MREYIGIHDGKGNKIHEGDIVTIDSKHKAVVTYILPAAQYRMVTQDDQHFLFQHTPSTGLEVVDSIYQNNESN